MQGFILCKGEEACQVAKTDVGEGKQTSRGFAW